MKTISHGKNKKAGEKETYDLSKMIENVSWYFIETLGNEIKIHYKQEGSDEEQIFSKKGCVETDHTMVFMMADQTLVIQYSIPADRVPGFSPRFISAFTELLEMKIL
jgi:hypothetical protein